MDANLAKQLEGKPIAFRKKDNPYTLIGFLLEVTPSHIIISFRDRKQIHSLEDIVDMEEGFQ